MIAYIALGLSIFNFLMWIMVAIGIRKVFKKMLPMFNMMGITQSQNLTHSAGYDKMPLPPQLADAESDK